MRTCFECETAVKGNLIGNDLFKFSKMLLNIYMQEILGHPDAKELINVGDRYEDSPLHVAAMNGYASVVEVSFNLFQAFLYFAGIALAVASKQEARQGTCLVYILTKN